MGQRFLCTIVAAALLAMSISAAGCGASSSSNKSPSGGVASSGSPTNYATATPASTNTQSVSPASATACTVAKAPILQGFFLGQSSEEVASRVKGFVAAYMDEKEGNLYKKEVNFVLLTYGQIVNKFGETEGFEDVSPIWHFLDDKLVGLVVRYTDDGTSDINEFVKKMAKANGLPETGWKFKREEQSAELSCTGFDVIVSTHPQNGPSIMLFDTAAEKEKQRRMKTQ